MKMTTVLALVSVGLAGVACSEPAAHEEPSTVAESDPVAVDDEYTGTLNLNLPSPTDVSDTGTGTLNLSIGGGSQDDGLIVGSSGFGGGNFGEAPTLELPLEDEAEDTALPVPDEDDDIIRLDPK